MNRGSRSANRRLEFSELERGVATGLWATAVAGHEWRKDLDPVKVVDPSVPDHGPWLVQRGREIRRYGVLRRRGLLEQFARLATDPSQDRILRFADRFGMLGRDRLLLPKGAKGGRLDVSGESFAVWTTACLEFADVWSLWRAVDVLRDPDVASPGQIRTAERLLRDRITIKADRSARYDSEQSTTSGASIEFHRWLTAPEFPTQESAVLAKFAASRDYVGLAGFEAARRVNRKIEGVSPNVLALRDFSVRFAPDTLETAIWFALGLDMARERPREQTCAHCGIAFVQTRTNRRFCSTGCQSASAYRRRRETPAN